MESILSAVAGWIINVVSKGGYAGIGLCMTIESACIPLPSEIIMPFSGYLVHLGRFTLLGVSLAGAIGCTVGSIIAYLAGKLLGRPFLEKYGRYVLISKKDISIADRWFTKHGDATVFFSRLLPVIRTFISFPAGVAKMNVPRFLIYTFVGSFPWCLALAYAGMLLGQNWETLRTYFRGADYIIAIVVIVAFVWWLTRHLKALKEERRATP
ncbi:MAG: DedA family protein [Candidatus Eisenbacteria bacterium]|nr:DedA family protein [Candidatus Eisenbacteria bacterium]